jgi:hypothetical protein
MDVRLVYDNSADNPRNRNNPAKRVLWGEQSADEMGSVTVQVVAVRKEDEAALQKFFTERTQAAIQAGIENGTARRFLQQRAAEQ